MKTSKAKTGAKPWSQWARGGGFFPPAFSKASDEKLFSLSEELQSWITSIVTFLHATHHLRFPDQASKEKASYLQKAFIAFLTEQNEWPHLRNELKSDSTHALSPALLVSRSYLRFEKNFFGSLRLKKHSQKFDMPEVVAESFSEGVDRWTNQIAELEPKLVFQLHLEGLKNEEISSLLQISVEEISLLLSSLKTDLKNDLQEGGFGT